MKSLSIRRRLQYGSTVLILLITALCIFNVWSSDRLARSNDAMSGALEEAVTAEEQAAKVRGWIALLDRVKADQDAAVRQLAEGIIGNRESVALYLTGAGDRLENLLQAQEFSAMLAYLNEDEQPRTELEGLRAELLAVNEDVFDTWMPRHGNLLHSLNNLKRTLLYWNLKITNMIFVRSSIGELVYEELIDTPVEDFRTGEQYRQYKDEFTQLEAAIENAAKTNRSLYQATDELDTLIFSGNWNQVRKHYRDNFPEMIKSIAVDIDQVIAIEELAVNAQQQTLTLLGGELREVNNQLFNTLAGLRNDLHRELSRSVETVAATTVALQDKRTAAADLVASAGRTNIIFSLIVIILGLTGSVLITRSIIRPLNVVVDKMEDVARGEGDLTRTIDVTARHEMGLLANNFNLFVAKLREIIHRSRVLFGNLRSAVNSIDKAAQNVRDGANRGGDLLKNAHVGMSEVDRNCVKIMHSTETVLQASRESSSATLELTSVIEEITGQTERLSSVVAEVTSSNQEMSASSQEIAGNIESFAVNMEQVQGSVRQLEERTGKIETVAEQTSRQAEQAYTDAREGRIAVDASIAGIEVLNDIVNRAGETMAQLGEESDAIGQILQVIDDIAEQTNLLALNATIISAQAGEHGRAFGVVAEEVRQLANRTASSTREISTIVTNVQRGTSNAVNAISAGQAQVEQEVAQARAAGERLSEIETSSKLSAQHVKDIVVAAREQSTESGRITDIVENATGMLQQIAASVQQQNSGVKQTARASENMREIALQLQRGTEEQTQGSRMISRGMEQIKDMIEEIDRATRDQAGRSQEVVALFEQMRAITDENVASSGALEVIVAKLVDMAGSLEQELGSFKIEQQRKPTRAQIPRKDQEEKVVSIAAMND